MKINSELERVLLGEQTKLQKTGVSPDNSASKAFGNLFESELNVSSNAQTQAVSSSDTASLGVLSEPVNAAKSGPVTKTSPKQSTDEDDEEEDIIESILLGIQETLEEMEEYSNSLQDAASLKKAWASLDAMNQNIGSMQKDYAKLASQNPSIGTMLNSLEVSAVTETYKFNRGDYL